MQGTTRKRVDQPWLVVLHALAVSNLLGLALLGQVPAEVAGWLVLPARTAGRVRGSAARWGYAHWRALGDYLAAELAAGVVAEPGVVGFVGLERRVGAGLVAPATVGVVVVAGRRGRVA